MAGFQHHASEAKEPDDPQGAARRARIGLVLFFVYSALYAGFMLLNAFAPQWMESTPWAGINLAVLYGFGLIVAALVLALIYAWLCRERSGG